MRSIPARGAQKAPPARSYRVHASKTVHAGRPEVFAAWTDARRRARWLVGVRLTLLGAVAPRQVRLLCEDDATEIVVALTAPARGRCRVAVDHRWLAHARMVAERRHCWKEMLRNLAHHLAGSPRPD